MGKIFYTEREIEDMAKSGINEISVNNNVVFTDLAYAAVIKHGITISNSSTNNYSEKGQQRQVFENISKIGSIINITESQLEEMKKGIKQSIKNNVSNPINDELLDFAIEKTMKSTPFTK